jgi:small-conductance mechanosensitive channel
MIGFIEQYKTEIVETILILTLVFGGRFLINKFFVKAREKFHLQKSRGVITKKIINGTLFFAGLILIFFIWGVDKKELALFFSSFIAILGIALFAQWSMLSNITSSIILFIYHPAKIGDKIAIIDKENPMEGKIKDIGAFFIIVKTDKGEIVTIPNSLIFQKMVQIVSEGDE